MKLKYIRTIPIICTNYISYYNKHVLIFGWMVQVAGCS